MAGKGSGARSNETRVTAPAAPVESDCRTLARLTTGTRDFRAMPAATPANDHATDQGQQRNSTAPGPRTDAPVRCAAATTLWQSKEHVGRYRPMFGSSLVAECQQMIDQGGTIPLGCRDQTVRRCRLARPLAKLPHAAPQTRLPCGGRV